MRRALFIAVVLLGLTAPIARANQVSRNQEAFDQGNAEACRLVLGTDRPECNVDGFDLSEANVAAYERSWVHQAIALQRQLDEDVPLEEALFPHTHNSFNSEAYTPTLSRHDHNQLLSITDQLRLDIRAIEIDVHRLVPAPDQPEQVVACHANEPSQTEPLHVHIGCTTEDTLDVYLVELETWLKAHPDEVIILYLENHLEGDENAHDTAVEMIEATIGDRVYRPVADGCAEQLPIDLSRADVRKADKQVLLTGDCGPGRWNSWVFKRGDRWDESGNDADVTYDCDTDRALATSDYDNEIVRRYEDRTWLTVMVDPDGEGGGITASEMADMVRCGVNLAGFDMLHPDDPRLASLVWSWAPETPLPTSPGCTVQRRVNVQGDEPEGRWFAADCNERHPAACYADGDWSITAEPVKASQAASACAFRTPWNGWENARLFEVATGDVWVQAVTPCRAHGAKKPCR